jgi:hypothetical protein
MEKVSIGIGVSSIGCFLPLTGKAGGLFAQPHEPQPTLTYGSSIGVEFQ